MISLTAFLVTVALVAIVAFPLGIYVERDRNRR